MGVYVRVHAIRQQLTKRRRCRQPERSLINHADVNQQHAPQTVRERDGDCHGLVDHEHCTLETSTNQHDAVAR
jgi:hypothetical protein